MGMPALEQGHVRALVMGVLNVTPDSFSDGGRWFDHAGAIAHGLTLVDEGADIVDVGGESTRPGHTPVDPVEERRRILPVIEALAPHVRVSVDTRHDEVARAAVDAGASLINDMSASLWPVAADTGAGWLAGHWCDEPGRDASPSGVRSFLVERAEAAVAAGVDEVWIDPGLGFAKSAAESLTLLAHLDDLVASGFPVCLGASRKSTLGRLLAASDARVRVPALPGLDGELRLDTVDPVPTDDRIEASLTAAVWGLQCGVRMLRVHDVLPTSHAVMLVQS